MAIKIDNVTYRNIQEQVQKNKEDIAAFKSAELVIADFGITVLGHVDTVDQIPEREYNYGNAYLVGTETPYDIYIFTRTDVEDEGEFIDLGPLAVEGPVGPEGPEGPIGPEGIRGSKIFSGTEAPAGSVVDMQEGDVYIRTSSDSYSGYLYIFQNNDWKYKGSIRGPQGIQGAAGPQGPRGFTGDVGPKGDKGDPGQSFLIKGKLASTSLLPDPEESFRNEAYVIGQRLYFIAGETGSLTWDYVEIADVGTTITQDNGTHKITSIDLSELAPNEIQIIGENCYMDNDMGLVITGKLYSAINGTTRETENAGAIALPLKDSDTIKINASDNDFSLNLDANLAAKIGKSLVVPQTAPTKTKLVGVDTSNAETLIDADSYLTKTFNAEQTLKNTGGTTPIRLESNSGDCWLRFWGSNGQIGELGGNGTDKMPIWWDTTKSYKICLDQSQFTNYNSQNSMQLGNMIINFGTIGSYSSGSGLASFNLTFKTAFSNANYWIMAVPDANTSDSPQSYDYTGMVKATNRTATGCTLQCNFTAGNKRQITYIAIGK